MIFRYLTGVDNADARALARTHGVGVMLQPKSYAPQLAGEYPVHAIDNGCFTPPGQPDRFDEGRWRRYLERVDPAGCLFAVAPDVPFDWSASWQRSRGFIDLIRAMRFPVAVAVQDGATTDNVPFGEMDAVFIGGSTSWKLGTRALEIAHAAHHLGKHVHMGRANSHRRFRRATEMLVDSADGTMLKYGPPAMMAERLRMMLDGLPPEMQLALA